MLVRIRASCASTKIGCRYRGLRSPVYCEFGGNVWRGRSSPTSRRTALVMGMHGEPSNSSQDKWYGVPERRAACPCEQCHHPCLSAKQQPKGGVALAGEYMSP